jgi:hypothetical protein
MTPFSCGDRVKYGNFEPGSSGCLVSFPDFADHVLMLTAGHVVLPPFARAGDAITRENGDEIVGRLFTWTTIDGDPTSDAALIWVDPAQVSPQIRGLGLPSGVNLDPQPGTKIKIGPSIGQSGVRETVISAVDRDVDILVAGPAWESGPTITYRSQILTLDMISGGGDSGAIALDDQNRVVGMVVAGKPGVGTVITPITSILANSAWAGRQLQLVAQIDSTAVAPPLPSPIVSLESVDVVLDWLAADQGAVAREVALRLKAGGCGLPQQAAALGNAMAESSLDPKSHNLTAKEDSVGLFQLNRRNGRGKGRTVEELQRIDVQCQVVLAWAESAPAFMSTDDVDAAVALFVTDFERPADAQAAIQKRQPIARRFLRP